MNRYKYIESRVKHPFLRLDRELIHKIISSEGNPVNMSHSLLVTNENITPLQDKPNCDGLSIMLWNTIMGSSFSITDLQDVKKIAKDYIQYMDNRYPNGDGASTKELIRYGTANSASAFVGIQNPRKSQMAMDSMISTLESHANPIIIDKSYLISNLDREINHVNKHRLMDKKYADICMVARASSSSIDGEGSFRDYVAEHNFDDILAMINSGEIPYLIYAGVRTDRRGKYRLICSFDGRFRIVDYLLNNGSYDMCEGHGVLAPYTTEGFNNYKMWPELVTMSNRDMNKITICLDYKGYDSQISMDDYTNISKALNEYRVNDKIYGPLMEWYYDWLDQPKPLVVRTGGEYEVLLPLYKTLASGLHGTHSFENLIGISVMKEAENRGTRILRFWTNGDDQNSVIHRSQLDKYMEFAESQNLISWDKSLIGHSLSVWGKLWFTNKVHPFWEIGTFRSIWESENASGEVVKESKFQSNYCKILQVIITLRRLGLDKSIITFWMELLCDEIGVDPYRLPVNLTTLEVTTSNSKNFNIPRGIKSARYDLMSRTFKLQSLNVGNFYDMLINMHQNKQFFDMDVKETEYYPEGTTLSFTRGTKYHEIVPEDVPWVYKDLFKGMKFTEKEVFNRDVLQGTKSYDGPCSISYRYDNMMSLAYAIDDRNQRIWLTMTK